MNRSFDSDGGESRRAGRQGFVRFRLTAKVAGVLAASVIAPITTAGAQLPGVPVLQNAWATPGIVAAANIGGGSDGSVYAGAVGWTPGVGHFQVSGGLGFQSRTGASSRVVYGARVAVPFGGAASSFGFGAFGGIGGGPAGTTTRTTPDSVRSSTQIPVGVAIGWRHAIGPTHGVSVYATPSYVFFSGGSSTSGLIRTGLGADIGITRSIGATAGVDFGKSRGRGVGGPSGSLFGLGVSYALGRR